MIKWWSLYLWWDAALQWWTELVRYNIAEFGVLVGLGLLFMAVRYRGPVQTIKSHVKLTDGDKIHLSTLEREPLLRKATKHNCPDVTPEKHDMFNESINRLVNSDLVEEIWATNVLGCGKNRPGEHKAIRLKK